MSADIIERRAAAEPLILAPAGATEPVPAPAPAPAVERLHALVRKGYAPEFGTGTATDLVVLRHLGPAPDLILHADGIVAGYDGRIPRFKRHVEPPPAFGVDLAEQLRFMKFLDSVPKASLRDRTRRFRHRYVYVPIVFALLVALNLAITALIQG